MVSEEFRLLDCEFCDVIDLSLIDQELPELEPEPA
jgi:hypothetical protein